MFSSKTATETKAARVLIVDDHPAVREALAIRIAREADLEVCGEAEDDMSALRLSDLTNPDVAVVDLALKSASGIDLIKRLKARHENLVIIVWSMYSEDLYAERALRAGARGYINKSEATGKIIEVIRHVLNGELYLSPAMTARLVEHAVGQEGRASLPGGALDKLSDRELDVFRLIGQGRKTADIAAQLHLSVKTIETYRDRIRAKLGLPDGAALMRAAVHWAIENG
jgi:DNA-binding NarL/FixJ family response regulator